MKAGIIDPTKVVRSALQNAASVASLLLTTECMVAEKPEEKGGQPAAYAGGRDDVRRRGERAIEQRTRAAAPAGAAALFFCSGGAWAYQELSAHPGGPGTYRPVDDRQIRGQALAVNVIESLARDSSELCRMAEGRVQYVRVNTSLSEAEVQTSVVYPSWDHLNMPSGMLRGYKERGRGDEDCANKF